VDLKFRPPRIIFYVSHVATLRTYFMEQSPWEAKQLAASKESPLFYGTRRFITAFTSVRHFPYPEPAQCSPYPHISSLRSILIFSQLHRGLLNDLFPSCFPTKTLYTPPPPPFSWCYSCRKLGITKLGPLLMLEGITKCMNRSVGSNVKEGPAPTNTLKHGDLITNYTKPESF
jgi:hypothetical protein